MRAHRRLHRIGIAVAALVNLWSDVDGGAIYSAYIVDTEAAPGLEVIYSPPPQQQVELNWLNVFYAIEWVVFAGFAIFLWYRLVKDAYVREQEETEAFARLNERFSAQNMELARVRGMLMPVMRAGRMRAGRMRAGAQSPEPITT